MRARVPSCLLVVPPGSGRPPRGARALVAALALFALPACQDPCADSTRAPAVELGTGEDAFASVADGDVLEAGSGGQGGQHVWAALRVTDLVSTAPPGESGALTVEVGVEHADGPVATYGPAAVRVPLGKDAVAGLTAILSADPWSAPFLFPDGYDPENATGDEADAAGDHRDEQLASGLRFWITASDRCGDEAADERTIGLTGVWRMF